MRIAVLMTCFNRRQRTLNCLRSLFAQSLPTGVVCRVYLVDDGCTDHTGQAVREEFPAVHILQGTGQLYWCGGMRLAWAEAMKEDYDAYLWLNDDTTLLPKAVETLLVTARQVREREGVEGIIVGSCRDPRTGGVAYGGRVRRRRGAKLATKLLAPANEIQSCDSMNGNLVLIPRSVYQRLGNLHPAYTHAIGDGDYGLTATRYGVPVRVAPGYLAECGRNEIRAWANPQFPLRDRWRSMCSPLGLPPRQWLVYVKRHTGWRWPCYCISPFVRLLLPRLWLRCSKKQNIR